MTRVIAVANLKGGTAKSTTVANLAAAWGTQRSRRRVLAIDFDPQANLTAMFGRYPEDCRGTVEELFVDSDRGLSDLVERDVAPGVDLLAAGPRLANVELTLAGQMSAELFLSDALEDQIGDYRVVLIDCPPQLGKLTPNALFAANEVVVPVSMLDRNAYDGAANLLANVAVVQRRKSLEVTAIVETLVDSRRRTFRALDAEVRSLGPPVAETRIPLRSNFNDSGVTGRPVVLAERSSPGGVAYAKLAEELEAPVALRSAA